MRVLELFAGAGGMALGFHRAGFDTVALAEWDDHARCVLRARFPDVPLYGDVTAVDGREVVANHGPVDLVSGGAPCQDLSVAGKRAGLDGSRSVLFYDLIRIWEETGATYCLYENVCGALSSNKGADFAAVLSAFVGADVPVPSKGWKGGGGVVAGPTGVAAWRVLDAQFFGVPQRRRRVFVLGARPGGVDPAAVLLEWEGMCGDSAASSEAGKGATRETDGGARDGDECLSFKPGQSEAAGATFVTREVAPTLQGSNNGSTMVPAVLPADGGAGDGGAVCATGQITHALTRSQKGATEDGTGRGTPIVVSGADGGDGVTTLGALDTECGYSKATFQSVVAGHVVVPALPASGAGTARTGNERTEAELVVVQDDPMEVVDKQSGQTSLGISPTLKTDLSHDMGPVVVQEAIAWDEELNARVGLAGTIQRGGDGGRHEGVLDGVQEAVGYDRYNDALTGPVAPVIQAANSGRISCVIEGEQHATAFHENQRGEVRELPVFNSLAGPGGKPGQGYPAVLQPDAVGINNDSRAAATEGLAPSLRGGARAQPSVLAGAVGAFNWKMGAKANGIGYAVEQAPSVTSEMTPAIHSSVGRPRRLLPIECERLMAWPDNWTAVLDPRGKPMADSHRYKMCGNGVVSHVAEWIGRRLLWAEANAELVVPLGEEG